MYEGMYGLMKWRGFFVFFFLGGFLFCYDLSLRDEQNSSDWWR